MKQFATGGPHLYRFMPPNQGSQLGSSWLQVSICKFIYRWFFCILWVQGNWFQLDTSRTWKHTLLFVSLHSLKLRYLILTRTLAAVHPHFHWGHPLIVGECPMFIRRVCESWASSSTIWRVPEMGGTPNLIIHFSRIFHYKHKPSILGYPHGYGNAHLLCWLKFLHQQSFASHL